VSVPLLESINCAWNDVELALLELRQYGSVEASDYLEAIVSCAATLGALESNHSAIVGPSTFDRDNRARYLDGALQTDLGRRRKAACTALAERAVARVAQSGLVGQDGERGRTLATLLRVTVGVVEPNHEFLHQVNSQIQTRLRAKAEPVGRTIYTDRTIGADLVLALATGQAPI